MTKKTRYSLLLVGLIIFLILAPLIVLYVRGITYDFATKSFVKTGILGIRTSPKNVDIFLNNKLKRQSSGDINFLTPGEYQITLKKQGYNDWNKRLTVDVGQVTWANPVNNSIYLLISSPTPKVLDQKVLDFYGNGGGLIYLTDGYLTYSGQNYALPKTANKILAVGNGGKNFVLSQNATSGPSSLLYFNSGSGQFTDLSALFSGTPQIQFAGNGDLYALSNNTLYKVDVATATKTAILQSVETFYWQGNSLYYIQQKQGTFSLAVSQDPFSQSQTLLSGVPKFSQGALFVTFGKQIFLEADNSLYQDTGSFEKVADSIGNYNFDSQGSLLAFFQSGEFDYIDGGQNINVITRSGETLNNLTVKTGIDYAFYSKNNQIGAIELDNRGSQNQYVLYSGQNLQKFSMDSAGQNIILLDNGELKSIVIR